MKTLIIKLGAAGDVLRTTTLLKILPGQIDWLTSDENLILLTGNPRTEHCVSWSDASRLMDTRYDLVINLEDSEDVGQFLNTITHKELFGSYLSEAGKLTYTDSSREWFDLGLISRFGKTAADELKLKNRRSYQEILFSSLGYTFGEENYFCPQGVETGLTGDIAICNSAGAVWPMKKWAFYDELKLELEKTGYKVNVLPTRPTVLEHIADVQNHKCLISGDSLPMHIALGGGTRCVTIFQCTSPWEIYDYGLQTKVVSQKLEKYFYKRHFDAEATNCVRVKQVYEAVIHALEEKEKLIQQQDISTRSMSHQLKTGSIPTGS